jgi:CheY-like chemotaxis protein
MSNRNNEGSSAGVEGELKIAQLVIEQLNQAKSRFLASMSHELRTPLNGVLGYAHMLRVDGGLSSVQSERVDNIIESGNHLLQMIKDVLILTEVEDKLVVLEATEIDPYDVVGGCLELVRPLAETKELLLRISMTPGVPLVVKADPSRLRQVLLNLLTNAVQFTEQGRVEVRLRCVADNSALRFEVIDTGPGIPADQRHFLFQSFTNLATEFTREVQGAGLGLAVSSRIASLMGGRLGHDDNPEGGSVFWLELSLAPAPTPPIAAPPLEQLSTTHSGRPLLVLIVDDVAMNREIAGSFLRAAGHKDVCVAGGAEAIAVAATTDFDAILMDIRMPEMDGLEATRRIRALEGGRGQVPIVAMTAQSFAQQIKDCRRAGMNGHVPKPFDPDTLVAAVLRATATRHQDTSSRSICVPIDQPTVPETRVIGSGLTIFDVKAFERTASFLEPDAVISYMQNIALRGEALLRMLNEPDALAVLKNELATATHTLVGSAGMFGFERVTAIGRRFMRAVETGASETLELGKALRAAIGATLQQIHSHTAGVSMV